MKKRMLSLVLLMVISICSSLIVSVYAEEVLSPNGREYTKSEELASRLDSIFGGNASVYSNASCTQLVNTSLGKSTVPNNGVVQYVGPAGGPALNSGTSCWIYANGVYYTLFGEALGNGSPGQNSESLNTYSTSTQKITYENFVAWGVRNGVGAQVRVGYHSFIVLCYDSTYLTYLDGNGDGRGLVAVRKISWSEASGNSNLNGTVHYIIQPKESYYNAMFPENSNDSYLSKCEKYPSYAYVKVIAPTTLKSLPCSKGTDAESVDIHTCSIFDELKVTAIYKNTAGKYWYETSYEGQTCYVYAGDAQASKFLSGISISGVSAPETLNRGDRFSIKGTVSSETYCIDKVEALVKWGDNIVLRAEESVNANTYSLLNSSIDYALTFNTLNPGRYKYVITARQTLYYYWEGELTSHTWDVELWESDFTINGAQGEPQGDSWLWPAKDCYIISSNFGNRDLDGDGNMESTHTGIDIIGSGTTFGQPVYASKSGTVYQYCNSYGDNEKDWVGGSNGMGTYGNYVIIQHDDGLYSIYAHMRQSGIKTGGTVSQGDIIGYIGNSGASGGAHLHFQIFTGFPTSQNSLNPMPTNPEIKINNTYSLPSGWDANKITYTFEAGQPGELYPADKVPTKPEFLRMSHGYNLGDSVVFEWNDCLNVTHYTVFVEKLNDDGSYTRVYAEENLSSGLSLNFDAGTYRAFMHAVNSDYLNEVGLWLYSQSEYAYFDIIDGYTGLNGSCGDRAKWTFNSETGVLTVSGTGDTWNFGVGYSAVPWEANRNNVKEIVIEEGIAKIGCSFHRMKNLEKVTLPASVEYLGAGAFAYNPSLKAVTLMGEKPEIDPEAFADSNPEFVSWEAHEHDYERRTVSPTCTEQGYTEYLCGCGESYRDNYVPATGHYYTGDICNVCGADAAWIKSGECGDNLTWKYHTGTKVLTISGTGDMWDYSSELWDKNKREKPSWAEYSDDIQSVIIEDGVTSIGDEAFYCYTGITSAVIPAGITSIGKSAFYNCEALTSISLPDGLKSIGSLAFFKCIGLRDIVIPDTVESIGSAAFYECYNLETVIVESSVTVLEEWLFGECHNLKNIVLPDGITKIEYCAFYYCKNLKEIDLPDKLTTIEWNAFLGCSSLESLTLPATVTIIEKEAFNWCRNLTVVYFCGDAPSVVAYSSNDANSERSFTGAAVLYYTPGSKGWTESEYYDSETGTWNGYTLKAWEENEPEHTHSYTAAVIAPTCTEEGYTAHSCECGDSYKDNTVAATGHEWDDGKVTKEPAENVEGEKTFTCTVCKETKTEKVAPLDHTHKYTDKITVPTCTEEGYTTHTCACGDSYKDTTVPATGHKWDNGTVTKQPTTAAEGEKTFACTVCKETKIEKIDKLPEDKPDDPKPADNPFKDVAEKDYYFEPVMWAVEKGVTSGLSADAFGPAAGCTRAQVVTFLWRAAGEPAPKSSENPFKDVKEGMYYYDAVLWAVENGITAGLSADTFGPDANCNRGQIVTFLWRANGKPAPANSSNPFTDVPETQYYYDAVLWAVEKGVTAGMSAESFAPDSTCTRAQIVTFLYRAYK